MAKLAGGRDSLSPTALCREMGFFSLCSPCQCEQSWALWVYSLVSAVSYSLSLSSSKMSTSTLALPARSGARLMRFLARVMESLSPLLHSMGSSRMAAVGGERCWHRLGVGSALPSLQELCLCSWRIPLPTRGLFRRLSHSPGPARQVGGEILAAASVLPAGMAQHSHPHCQAPGRHIQPSNPKNPDPHILTKAQRPQKPQMAPLGKHRGAGIFQEACGQLWVARDKYFSNRTLLALEPSSWGCPLRSVAAEGGGEGTSFAFWREGKKDSGVEHSGQNFMRRKPQWFCPCEQEVSPQNAAFLFDLGKNRAAVCCVH